MTDNTFPAATILGYPRIGPRRELKKALENFWSGASTAAELEQTCQDLRHRSYAHLTELGLDAHASAVPASFSYYDQVLDTAVTLGAVPSRFADLFDGEGKLGLDAYFTLARGDADRAPLEMTKWFDTNYHYLVPELGPETGFRLANEWIVENFTAARQAGFTTRPVLVGPVSFLLLSKAADGAGAGFEPLSRLADVLPVYAEVLRALAGAGVEWVQLEEPALVADQDLSEGELGEAIRLAYTVLATELQAPQRPRLLVTSSYGSLGGLLPVLATSGVDALHLDLVNGAVPAAVELEALGSTVLVAGLVDGQNIWKTDLAAAAAKLGRLEESVDQLAVATSTSLFHVPHDVEQEQQLDPVLRSWLAFADQKVDEVRTLARAIGKSEAIAAEVSAAAAVLETRRQSPGVRQSAVRARTGGLVPANFTRDDFESRRIAQQDVLRLPALPTTTIGSFPQTRDIRLARARALKGELGAGAYEQLMKDEIKRVIELQEELGLDVLVHGEPERNDMVQYFAENLDGFDVTVHGWVQSYGSRCTRPSILWGDVSRPAPITVPWTRYAQSLTDKPVKGMLTGPVTILAWSFVRDDQALEETANQVALALRDEISDLQEAGTKIIQVDEPALRELLPLRRRDHADYLRWSVGSFKLATAGVAAATQIHTHLCYSEFGEIIDAIDALDADVTSIEAARSRMEVVKDLEQHGFARGVGPGIYDIHSPRIPSAGELQELLSAAVAHVPVRQLWVNPDCGLKTRAYPETKASLENLVEAARTVRASLVDSLAG